MSGKKFLKLTSFTTDRQLMEFVQLSKLEEIGVVSDAGTPGLSDPGK
jgi:16S rRNA C1402 (ribose-2'-O) methylase RsmI